MSRNSKPPRLTLRESEIAQLVAQGLTNREIAEMLYLSLDTIKTHLKQAFQKCGVRNRAALATWAATHFQDIPPQPAERLPESASGNAGRGHRGLTTGARLAAGAVALAAVAGGLILFNQGILPSHTLKPAEVAGEHHSWAISAEAEPNLLKPTSQINCSLINDGGLAVYNCPSPK